MKGSITIGVEACVVRIDNLRVFADIPFQKQTFGLRNASQKKIYVQNGCALWAPVRRGKYVIHFLVLTCRRRAGGGGREQTRMMLLMFFVIFPPPTGKPPNSAYAHWDPVDCPGFGSPLVFAPRLWIFGTYLPSSRMSCCLHNFLEDSSDSVALT